MTVYSSMGKTKRRKGRGNGNQITLYDPFNTTNVSPKIPDGKAQLSCGIRCQGLKEMYASEDGGPLLITVFPGLPFSWSAKNSFLVGANANEKTINRISPTNHEYYDKLDIRAPINDADADGDGVMDDDAVAVDPIQLTGVVKIDKWRIVSQGLKVSVVNSCEEIEGWWECIRTQWTPAHFSQENGGFYCKFPTGAPSKRDWIVNANGAVVEHTMNPTNDLTGNWMQHPTYQTGKLKDIHKMAFNLKQTSADHDFVTIRQDIYDELPANVTNGELLDPAMDCLHIRLHGVPASEANFTKYLLHHISNQEIVFDELCDERRFMTRCYYNPKTVAAAKRATVNGNIKSARYNRSWNN